MSLRARLTLLNTFIVGGILLLFGTAIYFSVSITLTRQIDRILGRGANQVLPFITMTSIGELDMLAPPQLDLTTEMVLQVWGRGGDLKFVSRNIEGFQGALDPDSIGASRSIFRDHVINNVHLRVLTIPLISGNADRIVGRVQLATSMYLVDSTQRILLIILLIGSAAAMTIAGLVVWFSVSQALKPLNLVTQTALQITRADDLSHRIPYHGPPHDEVGQLINAFNQTLSRLENLFNSQRRFLADVGHELRTPLTVIKGNVDLMRRMNCTDEESMSGIENEVSRLTRLVGDLLLLAQAESGKMPLARKTVELDTLVLEVLQQMSVLARDKLALRLGEIDQVLVCGDQDRLKQVLLNLVGNAIQYTPMGGEVIVGVGKVDDRARLTVSDTGPGIPAEDLPYIFERFYRAEKSRTRQRDGKGFGLGLSIAYWIVRNHGGQIQVEPNLPQGTTFCVWLPLATNECQDDPGIR
jgi:two-component system, OmpR family, sensor kinase